MKRKMFSLFTTIVLLICFFVTSSIKILPIYAQEQSCTRSNLESYKCSDSNDILKCLDMGNYNYDKEENIWQEKFEWVFVTNCKNKCVVFYPNKEEETSTAFCKDQDISSYEKEITKRQERNKETVVDVYGKIKDKEIIDPDYDLIDYQKNGCVDTALGCIPFEAKAFSAWLIGILFGISGGIALLLMVYGFILVATSSGDEKKLQGAKETITSAITGLLVSIFALLIFRLIAVNILHIPGF